MLAAMTVATLLIMPFLFVICVPAFLTYYLWISSLKFRLPFRVPMNWQALDWGSPKPGRSGKVNKAKGILYLGVDEQTEEELWLENGDARRHGFFIGTTGSGKALPLDMPVLTPNGWVENGGLRAGDTVCHPDGTTAKVLSIHPQGAIEAVRLVFADGRDAICSADHLWHVRSRSRPGRTCDQDLPEEGRIMEARDIGILFGLYGGDLDMAVPYATPVSHPLPNAEVLSRRDAMRAVETGLEALPYMPSAVGAPEDRKRFLSEYVAIAGKALSVDAQGMLRMHGLVPSDAIRVKQIAWSLGGRAMTIAPGDGGLFDVVMGFPGVEEIHPEATFDPGIGLPITAVEPVDEKIEMSCIKVDRDDGLYVMENHVVTHNTELLLGVVSQTLMWSSGFLFIDGKGTRRFYARAWTLCRRFGREDDVRVLNFKDAGGDPDAPAGGPDTQSNTLNPFTKGSPDQLMNIIVSLMGDAGGGNDMWKNRAESLVTALMMALCELRDNGDILMNVQTIRDFLALGRGFDKKLLRGKRPTSIDEVPEEAWEEMRTRAGLIELYLRAMRGELSNTTRLALKGFFDTLPGFNIDKALSGEAQETKASEQYGFLSMQLTKPLGSLADGYGHIFRTPLGEVDMDDVVLNRRILIVLLPALERAPAEMQNCGKIVVTLVKMMMGKASGYKLQGSRQEIVDADPTTSPTPYIVVMDEAGYYMVEGIDVSLAQARSLGFMIIVAGQDMAAMQKVNKQIAETTAANASILAVGKTVDGAATLDFIMRLVGKTTVSVSSGFEGKEGLFGKKWVDRNDATMQEVDKIKVEELQNMGEGQFYFLFNGKLVRSATFFIGEDYDNDFSVNKFIKVRGPTDRVPGLDQSREIALTEGIIASTEALALLARTPPAELPENDEDRLAQAVSVASSVIAAAGQKTGDVVLRAQLVGLAATGMGDDGAWQTESDTREEDFDDDFSDIEDDTFDDIASLSNAMEPETSEAAVSGHAGQFKSKLEQRRELHRKIGRAAAGVPEKATPAEGLEEDTHAQRIAEMASAASHDVAVEEDERISRHIDQSLGGASERDRHTGLVGLLEFEKKRREQAASHNIVQDVPRKSVEADDKKTIASLFGSMAQQMDRVQRMMLTEMETGTLGEDIMSRASLNGPVSLPQGEAEKTVRQRMETIQKACEGSTDA